MSIGLLLLFLLVFTEGKFELRPNKDGKACKTCTKDTRNAKCWAVQSFYTFTEYRFAKINFSDRAVLTCEKENIESSGKKECKVDYQESVGRVKLECTFEDWNQLAELLSNTAPLKEDAKDVTAKEHKSKEALQSEESVAMYKGWNIFGFVAFGVIASFILIGMIYLIVRRVKGSRKGHIDHMQVATNQARIISMVENLNERPRGELKTAIEEDNRDEVSTDAKEKSDSGKKGKK